jgi:hydrogenase nickel incorporation protein HypA/HybF
MHELSVTEALLSLALEHAQRAQAERITDVYIVIGQLSAVIDESVQFYWDAISAGTPAAGAALHFRRVPTSLRCQACGHRYAPAAEVLACPACGSVRVRLTSGDELYLEALDVDAPSGPAAETELVKEKVP